MKVKNLPIKKIISRKNQRIDFFQYSQNPRIFILDFKNLKEQGKTMNRLASFIEKANAPKQKLLNNSELDEFIKNNGDNQENFYLGHNYSASDLARFFMTAKKQKLKLYSEEYLLEQILKENNFFNYQMAVLVPEKFLITLSKEQPQKITLEKRKIILNHELKHAKYFFDSNYQQYCHKFWKNGLTQKERALFLRFLDKEYYDISNLKLVISEMQAYLIYTPYTWFRSGLGISIDRLEIIRKSFKKNLK